ncbi:hypothetical protein RQP46_010408 [Phenoliferia psychrophenolica]
MLALRPLSRSLLPLLPRLSTRSLATAASIADIPVVAPTDKIAFKAPEVDTTKGELGQVYLPDLRQHFVDVVSIPTAPDNYVTPSTAPDAHAFPSFHAPQVHTVASTSTHLSPPTHGAYGADDAMAGEVGDSSSAVPAHKDVSTKPIPFEFVERDLNAEESRGLVVLAAIVVGGWVLGGVAKGGKKAEKKE